VKEAGLAEELFGRFGERVVAGIDARDGKAALAGWTDQTDISALDLALNNQMSLWDCVYLALAIEHDCPLITADRRLFWGWPRPASSHPSAGLAF